MPSGASRGSGTVARCPSSTPVSQPINSPQPPNGPARRQSTPPPYPCSSSTAATQDIVLQLTSSDYRRGLPICRLGCRPRRQRGERAFGHGPFALVLPDLGRQRRKKPEID